MANVAMYIGTIRDLQPATPTRVTMDARDDETLLAQIAQTRDRAAFDELYLRHSGQAFNVAFHICGNRTLAEEAVQEAFLSVWQTAHNFEPGNARSWIFRIVARKGIRVAQQRRSEQKRMPSTHAAETETASSPTAETLERRELVSALRTQIGELADLERQLLALHFGAGLSQHEISTTLGIPRQTISVRISKATDLLRRSLAQAGFAAALPLIGVEGLNEALSHGQAVPPGMQQKVISSLSQSVREHSVREFSRRLIPIRSTRWVVAALLSVAAVGTGIYWTVNASKAAPVSVAGTAAPAPAPAPKASLSVRWNFNTGPAADLKVLSNDSWTWKPGQNGQPGAMVCAEDQVILIALPQHFEKGQPFAITVKLISTPHRMQSLATWVAGNKTAPCESWNRGHTLHQSSVEQVRRMVFNGRYLTYFYQGAPMDVVRFEQEYPGDRVVMQFLNYEVQEISIQGLTPEEAAATGDPEKVIAEAERLGRPTKPYQPQTLPIPADPK